MYESFTLPVALVAAWSTHLERAARTSQHSVHISKVALGAFGCVNFDYPEGVLVGRAAALGRARSIADLWLGSLWCS